MTTQSGSWCWFSDPRSIYSAAHNKTYVGWVSPAGDIMASQYDHATNVVTTVNLHAGFNVDDHANPAFVEIGGRVYIFYTNHQGTDVFFRWTGTNGDISVLGGETGLGVAAVTGGVGTVSYCNPVYLSHSNRLTVFFRQNITDRSRWCVAVNDDGMTTSALSGYVLWDTGVSQSGPYCKVCDNGVDSIDMLLTDNHPANGPVSIYHARFRDVGGALHWQSGTGVNVTSVPFGPSQATKVLDYTTVGNCWIQQIAYGADGVPMALMTTYPGNSPTDHRYRFKRLDGSAGTGVEICIAATNYGLIDGPVGYYYSPGCYFDGADPSKVYVAIDDSTGWRIEKWATPDVGATWAFSATISPADLSNKQFRPVSPKGYVAGTPSLFWWSGSYTNYNVYNATLKVMGYQTTRDAAIAACLVVGSDGAASVNEQHMANTLAAWLETQ